MVVKKKFFVTLYLLLTSIPSMSVITKTLTFTTGSVQLRHSLNWKRVNVNHLNYYYDIFRPRVPGRLFNMEIHQMIIGKNLLLPSVVII